MTDLLRILGMLSLDDIMGWVRTHRIILILLLIILLGGFLRIYDLGAESIWLDEVSSIQCAEQSLSSIIGDAFETQSSPPLYFIILHYWMLLFGTSEIAIRSLSAIFGILSIFLIYKVGCQLFNQKIGLISSFLLSISAFHVIYSQEARPYSLFLFLTLLSFYFFISILKADNKRYYLGYLLANIILGYSFLFGFFIIISQIFYFALFWKKYKHKRLKFAGAQICSVLAFIPLILLIMPRISQVSGGAMGSLSWVPEPSISSMLQTLADYTGFGVIQILLLPIFFVLCLIGLFSIRKFGGRWRVRFESVGENLLLLIWLCFPILIPFILSKLFNPVYVSRYTISALPALLILTAKGIGSLTNTKVAYAIIAFIALLSILGLQQYYAEPYWEQWRETVDLIEHHAQADDVIIICASYTQKPFDHYYRGDLERFGIVRDVTSTQQIDTVVDNAIVEKERLWLVLSNQGIAITEEYLVSRFGSESVVVEKEFAGVKVYLFNLHLESP